MAFSSCVVQVLSPGTLPVSNATKILLSTTIFLFGQDEASSTSSFFIETLQALENSVNEAWRMYYLGFYAPAANRGRCKIQLLCLLEKLTFKIAVSTSVRKTYDFFRFVLLYLLFSIAVKTLQHNNQHQYSAALIIVDLATWR